ncbi:hypothetical protein [Actinoplanes regularis]|uniref:hypothetical protein n=1 Tax=Actinoplanes regularis TaxID=52697 RepID=UPI0024A1349A|nr:hypothetical protein [Actinoplanes regularis]GLW34208.1 hypothetical protein Areg01_71450 [Actinoplanes regularis]
MTRRAVVTLLIVNLGVSVIFALITLVLHGTILAYQYEHHPDADPAALSRTLWTRPIPVLLVAVLYARLFRQLLAGDPRALRRVRIVSVMGLAGVTWLLLSAEYPAWLRIVEGVQLLLLAALAITVNLRVVRSEFNAPTPVDIRPRNRRAAWTLILVAPVVAELMLGNVPLKQIWIFPVFIPIYGAGALLIRELVRRTGGGFRAMLLLGLAYGLIEEGLALRSLTSPHIYGAAGWAPRLLGINSAYTELNLVYHPIFSITIPIVLTELIFTGHGPRRYLRRGGLIVTGAVAGLGALLVRVAVVPAEDPGYDMPAVAAVVIVAVAALVAIGAFRVRPKGGPVDGAESARPSSQHAFPPTQGEPPLAIIAGNSGSELAACGQPATVEDARATGPAVPLSPTGLTIWFGVAAFGFLALLFPFAGSKQSFFTHGNWAFLPMIAAAAIVTAAGVLLRRWTANPAWTQAHLLGAALGAIIGHIAFGLVANAETLPDRLFLVALAALTTALGAQAIRRLSRPTTQPGPSTVLYTTSAKSD